MYTYGEDLAYSPVYFCCSAVSNKPSRKRAAASSLERARFLDCGMALPSREALVSVLRFIFDVCRGMGVSPASGLMFHRFFAGGESAR